MGYGHRRGNPQIETYWPDNTDTELYFADSVTLSEIMETIKEKWPDCNLDSIVISSEYIHTDCLTYDLYDPSDYTEFVVVTRGLQND